MITTREKLYEDVKTIFSMPLVFIEHNKDGIIFEDEKGTQFQIKVTQKKGKVEKIQNTDLTISAAEWKGINTNWDALIEMSQQEKIDYEEFKQRIAGE